MQVMLSPSNTASHSHSVEPVPGVRWRGYAVIREVIGVAGPRPLPSKKRRTAGP